MRSLMAESSSSLVARSRATLSTEPAPILVGEALKIKRVVMVVANTWSQPSSSTVARHSVHGLAELVAMGLATVYRPSARARASLRASAMLTATAAVWAAAPWPMALQFIREVCGHGTTERVQRQVSLSSAGATREASVQAEWKTCDQGEHGESVSKRSSARGRNGVVPIARVCSRRPTKWITSSHYGKVERTALKQTQRRCATTAMAARRSLKVSAVVTTTESVGRKQLQLPSAWLERRCLTLCAGSSQLKLTTGAPRRLSSSTTPSSGTLSLPMAWPQGQGQYASEFVKQCTWFAAPCVFSRLVTDELTALLRPRTCM